MIFEQELRENIIRIARTWINTPFKNHGRVKNIGCDCVGLVISVLEEAGWNKDNLKAKDFDEAGYSILAKDTSLQNKIENILKPIDVSKANIGDIFLMKFKDFPQHVGFFSEVENGNIKILHAYSNIGKVAEHRLNGWWQDKVISAYKI